MIITIEELNNMTNEELVDLYEDIRTQEYAGEFCENEHEVVDYIFNNVDASCFECNFECPSFEDFESYISEIINNNVD